MEDVVVSEVNPGNVSQPEGGGTAADPKANRATFWGNLWEAIAHIRSSISSEGTRLRGSDYVSVFTFPAAAILLVFCQFIPNGLTYRPWVVLFLLLALLYFVASRIGVVKSFTSRQAHLVWMIIVATFISGAVFSLFVFEILRVM